MAKLKVFTGNLMLPRLIPRDAPKHHKGQFNVIMATTSQKKFTEATGIGRDYFTETGNQEQIAAAMSQPEVLLYGPMNTASRRENYKPVEPDRRR